MVVIVLCLILAGCSPAQRITVGPVDTTPLPKLQQVKAEASKKSAPTKVISFPLQDYDSTPDISGKWIEINLTHGDGQNQHFTAYEGTKAMFSGLVSGAVTDIDMPAGQHPDQPHNHLGWFRIREKNKNYWSKENECPMPNAVFYANGHGHAIHSCQVRDIKRLGRPASHGCTRVSPKDSVKIYNWVGDVGRYPVPVHIIR